MGGAPNYAKGRAAIGRMAKGKRAAFAQNIIIKDGKGKYPKCLGQELYYFCPKEALSDVKNVPVDCKFCQEYLKSRFYEETTREGRLKRIQILAAEMNKQREQSMIKFALKR